MSNDLAVGAGTDDDAHPCPDGPDCPHYDRDVANCADHRCQRHEPNRNAPRRRDRMARAIATAGLVTILVACVPPPPGPPPPPPPPSCFADFTNYTWSPDSAYSVCREPGNDWEHRVKIVTDGDTVRYGNWVTSRDGITSGVTSSLHDIAEAHVEMRLP